MSYLPARSTDPLTSWDAAERMEKSGRIAIQQARAVKAVCAHPGLTSFELASHCDLDRYQLARRLPEAEAQGKVVRGDARVCRISKCMATAWWPVRP